MSGSNFYSQTNNPLVKSAFNNDGDFTIFAEVNGNPNVVALEADTYPTGCIVRRTDITTGNNLYSNQGTITSPSWVLFGGGGGGTIGGSIAATEVAFGSGANTITGTSPNFTYDSGSCTLNVKGTTTTNNVTFSGSGLNDLTATGSYSGAGNQVYINMVANAGNTELNLTGRSGGTFNVGDTVTNGTATASVVFDGALVGATQIYITGISGGTFNPGDTITDVLNPFPTGTVSTVTVLTADEISWADSGGMGPVGPISFVPITSTTPFTGTGLIGHWGATTGHTPGDSWVIQTVTTASGEIDTNVFNGYTLQLQDPNNTGFSTSLSSTLLSNNLHFYLPNSYGTSGQALISNGSGAWSWGNAGGTPASPNTGIQYNNAGSFGADSNHTIDPSTGFSQLITNDFLATGYPIFAGTGINDITINGAWTAPANTVLTITVADGDPTNPNTISWSDTQGNSGSNIPMPSSGFINLSYGLQVAWTADNGTYNTTGHNTGDTWTITQYPASGGLQIGNNVGILTAGSNFYFQNDTNNNASFVANGDLATTVGLPTGNAVVTVDNVNSPTTVAVFLNGLDASGTPINKLFTQSNSLSAQSFIQSVPEEIDFGVQANGGNTAISMHSRGIYSITNTGSNFIWSDNAGNEYMNLLVATNPVFEVGDILGSGNNTTFTTDDSSQTITGNALSKIQFGDFNDVQNGTLLDIDDSSQRIFGFTDNFSILDPNTGNPYISSQYNSGNPIIQAGAIGFGNQTSLMMFDATEAVSLGSQNGTSNLGLDGIGGVSELGDVLNNGSGTNVTVNDQTKSIVSRISSVGGDYLVADTLGNGLFEIIQNSGLLDVKIGDYANNFHGNFFELNDGSNIALLVSQQTTIAADNTDFYDKAGIAHMANFTNVGYGGNIYAAIGDLDGTGNSTFTSVNDSTGFVSLQGSQNVRIIGIGNDTNYTVSIGNFIIEMNPVTTDVTLTLPPSPNAGDTYIVKNKQFTTFDVLVDGNGYNIDGSATDSLTGSLSVQTSKTYTFNGSEWSIF